MWARRGQEVTRYLTRKPHEPEFAAFALFRSRRKMFLDVGANMGQSAVSFRIFHPAPILSIEPNRFHEPDLRFLKRMLPRFAYAMLGAGDQNREATLHVPFYKGLPLTGEAALERDVAMEPWWVEMQTGSSDMDAVKIESVPIKVCRLDDLGLEPSFIKVDVEGSEAAVIRGLVQTITAHRPIILIECSTGEDDLYRLLQDLDYERYDYLPEEHRLELHTDGNQQNAFFIPAEA